MRRPRLDALTARVAALGECPRCRGRGLPGIAVRHHGHEKHPGDREPVGCSCCGRVSGVTEVILHPDATKPPPLPTDPDTING